MRWNAKHRDQGSARSRRICIGIAIVVVLVIAIIVIPIAFVLSKPKHHPVTASVLLPLYIYPSAEAWDPIYQAAWNNPHLNFTVVVNPDSGPGPLPYPDDAYTAGIQKLNNYSNIKTIGYVRTGYGTRNISEIVQDISTYSKWSSNSSGLAMHGIFFDEMVSDYSAQAPATIKSMNEAAKAATGLMSNRLIVHNPGTIPDSRLNDPLTDITVVFEEAYATFQSRESKLAALPSNSSAYCYMVHSVPNTMSTPSLRSYVNQLSQRAQYLFLTDLSQNYYESWGSGWQSFVGTVPT